MMGFHVKDLSGYSPSQLWVVRVQEDMFSPFRLSFCGVIHWQSILAANRKVSMQCPASFLRVPSQVSERKYAIYSSGGHSK